MAKYVINPKVINVHISQKIWTKADKVVFDTEGKFKKYNEEIEAAYKRGFLVLLEEKEEVESEENTEVEETKVESEEKQPQKPQQPKKRGAPKKK